ncbi:hypothetical protein B9T07_21860 [Limnospira fusiformis CCALA 023]|uniref:hypothetical protein n=1 Tax=Arthrospira sp. PCC 8006 TaxID=1982224 RepID=UPI00396F17B4
MTLAELKANAIALGLSKEDIRQFGDLRSKATWEAAIAQTKSEAVPEAEPIRETLSEQVMVNPLYQAEPDTTNQPKNQCTLKETGTDYRTPQSVILVTGACDGIEEVIDFAADPGEARHIANQVKLMFGQQIIIRETDGNSEMLYRRHDDEVDPDTLPELKDKDDRFDCWSPWMKVGAKFTTPRGNRFTIVGFDKWGNCHAIADGDEETQTFRLSHLIQYTPEADDDTRHEIIEKFRQSGVSDADIAELKASPLSVTGAAVVLGFLEGLLEPIPATGVVVGLVLSFFALG